MKPSSKHRIVRAILALTLAWTVGACATPEVQEPAGEPEPDALAAKLGLTGTEVLSDSGKSLGTVHFPTSCTAEAQPHLERGLALLETYPDDMEATCFHALALLATAPTTDKSYANQRQAGAIAQGVLVELPKHPGAHHYTIHAYDFPPLAEGAT